MTIYNTSLTLLAMKFGEKILTKKDTMLLIATFLAMILWYYTENDLVAIMLVCLIDSVGFYFTWKKSYRHPFDENLNSYIIWTLEFLCAFVAIEHKTLINMFHPALLTTSEILFVLFLLYRRKVVKK